MLVMTSMIFAIASVKMSIMRAAATRVSRAELGGAKLEVPYTGIAHLGQRIELSTETRDKVVGHEEVAWGHAEEMG